VLADGAFAAPGFVPADAWFGGAVDDPPIYEHTTPYGGPGTTTVLTMLWASQHEIQADRLAGGPRRGPARAGLDSSDPVYGFGPALHAAPAAGG
jgi:hypothetical protein